MPSSKRRGSRVVYVAESARELPEEVQDWLGQASNRAASSPNIYDALALLATGKTPVAIIVSMDAVDWNEFEFFDHVARLSRETRVYVAGHEHHDAKIEAACARGAKVFDPDALDEELEEATAKEKASGPAGLLAGSLRSAARRGRGAAESLSRSQSPGIDASGEPDRSSDPPPVRLVTGQTANEEDDAGATVPVPVPWSPSPDRPKRTPPKPASSDSEAPTAPPTDERPTEPSPAQRPSPVQLTPEELAALLGKPTAPPTGSAKEQRR